MHESTTVPGFLVGGGEMGQRIRDYDWSKTSLGSPDTWPKSLQTCIRIMLASRQPIWIGWGKELIKFYNDPYLAIVGGKHPWALGQPASVVWKDIWKEIEPMLRSVMEEDEGTYVEEQLLIMERNGYPEETYYTFSYTPIPGDEGGTGGMICANTDDTDRIISERQLQTITDLGSRLAETKTEPDVFRAASESLGRNQHDFPFAFIYKVEGDHIQLKSSSVPKSSDEAPAETVPLAVESELVKQILEVSYQKRPVLLSGVQTLYGNLPGAWDVGPDNAIILPIIQTGQKDVQTFLVVGLNPFRLMDEKYKSFFNLIADQIATSLSNVHALEEEKKRIEALAEIDKAKTTFFSNISHEFRTPLTLLLGPIQDAMNEPEDIDANVKRMGVAIRNAHRMQKLVNMLLDFSRIEAGKLTAHYSPVNIASLTEELSATFRQAIEKSGIQFIVNIAPFESDVAIDVEMWEKIVLNLLSNAFKYTRQGSIELTLKAVGGNIELSLRDTGSGIPEDQLEKVFERFHRVQNDNGRSQEGTGIGLAMVRELVKLHQGTIEVQSVVGQGSVFTVTLPINTSVTSVDSAISADGKATRTTSQMPEIFVEEAMQWILADQDGSQPSCLEFDPNRNTIVLADDNKDMLSYIHHLLSPNYNVVTAANGTEAYRAIIECKPDLVISDIMMPEVDGFTLLKMIREEKAIRNTPVIFLSARAGEESKIEGLDAGADDYLVKPFSSRELLAKTSSLIRISQVRMKAAEDMRNLFNNAPVAIAILRGAGFVVELANVSYLALVNRGADFIGLPLLQALPELRGQGIFELLQGVMETGTPYVGTELPVNINRSGEEETVYFNFVYHPLFENNVTTGVVVVATDVTSLVLSRESARQSAAILEKRVNERTMELRNQNEFVDTVLQSSIDLMMVFDRDYRILTLNKKVEDLYQVKRSDVIGKSVQEVFPMLKDDDYEKIKRVFLGETVHTKTYRAGKIDKYFESYLVPLTKDGGDVYAVLSTGHDITDIVNASTQIQAYAAQLEKVNETLINKNKELEQFAYISSHDLQEPLRKIQTFSELVRENLDNEAYVQNYLGKIESAAARMTSLIKDILQYSRLSSQQLAISDVDLNQVLENVKIDLELMITQKNASINHDGLPVIKGNGLQFQQLFFNLIGNSLKFSEQRPLISIRHVILKNEQLPDGIILDRNRSYRLLSFQDNGIGFDPEQAENIFGLFNRLQNRKDYSGTGIGLALCRKIVENHNGVIRAVSERGLGARFEIFLPTD